MSLARPDLYSGLIQKLNHKKAVVRLNLLRIVRSISDPKDENSIGITDHRLFEAIRRLAESDNAVLVRNMAEELVRTKFDTISGNETSRSRLGQANSRGNESSGLGTHVKTQKINHIFL